MGDMIRDGMAWLASQSTSYIAREVVYSRSPYSVTVSATVGRTERDPHDEEGGSIQANSRDYLIVAADLVLNSATVVPERGDRITDGSEVYEVLPLAGDDHYRPSDAYGIRFRIHTKRVTSA